MPNPLSNQSLIDQIFALGKKNRELERKNIELQSIIDNQEPSLWLSFCKYPTWPWSTEQLE